MPDWVCARCVEQGFCYFDTRSGVKRILDVEGHNDAVVSQEKPVGGEYIFRRKRGGGLPLIMIQYYYYYYYYH
jgi:hypothetical protein